MPAAASASAALTKPAVTVSAVPQHSVNRPAPSASSRPTASAAPVFKSIDESSELETTQTDSDANGSGPVKKDLFASLNFAESLDEGSHLLEVSESDQALLAATQAHQAHKYVFAVYSYYSQSEFRQLIKTGLVIQ